MANTVDRLAGASSSLAFKAPCRLATTANITLSGFQTVDGVLPTSTEHPDLRRILVKNQTNGFENGVYIMDTGAWERAKDFDGANDFRRGTRVFVWGGSTQSGGYVVTSAMDPDTFAFDTDDIDFTAQAAVDTTNWEFADGTGLYDDSGNEQLILQKASTAAANYIEITNSTAANGPSIAAAGSDTNILLTVSAKGAENIYLRSEGGNVNNFAAVHATTAGVNYLQASGAAAGSGPALAAVGSDSAIDLKLTAKSTGAVASTSVVRFDAAVTSTAITASGTITSSAITASGAVNVANAIAASSAVAAAALKLGATTGAEIAMYGATAVVAHTSATTGTDLTAAGITTISSAVTTWRLDPPSVGLIKHIVRQSSDTATTGTINLESGAILSSANSTGTIIALTGNSGISLIGISTALWGITARFPSTALVVIT